MEVSLKTVSDHRLLQGLNELVAKSRHDEADLLTYLAEVDRRKLFLAQGYSCMYRYCTEALHFSEASALSPHRRRAGRARICAPPPANP